MHDFLPLHQHIAPSRFSKLSSYFIYYFFALFLSFPSQLIFYCLVLFVLYHFPVKLRTFLDEFVSKFFKKTVLNSLSDVKEFEDLSNVTPCQHAGSEICAASLL